MSPWQRESLKVLGPPLLTAVSMWLGLVQPNTGAKDAQFECCGIARACVEGLADE